MNALYYYLFFMLVHPYIAMWWRIFPRTGQASWKALVPGLNYFYVFKTAVKKPWWFLLMAFPGVHIVMWSTANLNYLRRFGYLSLFDTLQGIFFPYVLYFKLAKDEKMGLIPETNWANERDIAKRSWGDHLVLFLGVPVLGHILGYVLSLFNKKTGRKSMEKEWGDSVWFALVAALIIRTYAFEPFQIPTGSMEKTLLVGDFLFVNKIAYGPKVPVTPVSYPLVHNDVPWVHIPSYSMIETCNYFRLPGYSKPQRNDVMVFNYPSGDTSIYDPVMPNGLMGHDYYGVLNQEAIGIYAAEKSVNAFTEENFKEFIINRKKYTDKAHYMLAEEKVAHRETEEDPTGLIDHYGLIPRPVDKRENYIKRCVALPGDLIEVKKSILFINGKRSKSFPYQNYRFKGDRKYITEELLKRAGIIKTLDDQNAYTIDNEGVESFFATNEQKKKLYAIQPELKGKLIPDLDPLPFKNGKDGALSYAGMWQNLNCYPKDPKIANTMTDYSKIRIPKKGATVKLTKETIAWYRRVIVNYEKHRLQAKQDGFYIDGKKVSTYTFKMNYYWLMGDNRYQSADSRVWGFVPEDHVVGRASLVWFSTGQEGIRWSRIFNLIK